MTVAPVLNEHDQVDCKPWTFASEVAAALYIRIGAATSSDELDQLASEIWRAYGLKAINYDDADALQSCIDRRRPLACARRGTGTRSVSKLVSRFIPRQRARSHDRQASRERRRTLGSAAVMPPDLRRLYTEGQRAVLCIIAGEVKHSGNCDLAVNRIAALAGVSRTSVQATLHEARRLGHVNITERPRPGKKNLTNVVHVVSAEWLTWLKRGPTAHHPEPIGSNLKTAEKNLRRDETLVSPTKNIPNNFSYEERRPVEWSTSPHRRSGEHYPPQSLSRNDPRRLQILKGSPPAWTG